MVQKTFYTATLKDISGIEFECKKCGASLTLNPDQHIETVLRCPQCSGTWMVSGASVDRLVGDFVESLQRLRKDLAGEQFDVNIVLQPLAEPGK